MHRALLQRSHLNALAPLVARRMATSQATLLLRERLAEKGLDICHLCNVSWYNRAVGEELALPFENQLAVLIGNSRALWQPLVSHYRRNPVVANPVEAYTSATIMSCFAEAELDVCDVYGAHDMSPGRLVAFQRLAHATGLAFYDQESFLCVHPHFGPWFALRALVVLPHTCTLSEPEALHDPTSPEVQMRVAEALCAAIASNDRFTPWVRLRDAVAPDHPMRYSEEQIRYHYMKELAYFRSIVDAVEADAENPTDHTQQPTVVAIKR